jgi:hypothetical protein
MKSDASDIGRAAVPAELARNPGASAAETREAAIKAILDAVSSGRIKADPQREWAEAIATNIDRDLVRDGRRFLASTQLNMLPDFYDQVICAIGESGRKLLGDVTDADVEAMDAERLSNVEDAQRAYGEWHRGAFREIKARLAQPGVRLLRESA